MLLVVIAGDFLLFDIPTTPLLFCNNEARMYGSPSDINHNLDMYFSHSAVCMTWSASSENRAQCTPNTTSNDA